MRQTRSTRHPRWLFTSSLHPVDLGSSNLPQVNHLFSLKRFPVLSLGKLWPLKAHSSLLKTTDYTYAFSVEKILQEFIQIHEEKKTLVYPASPSFESFFTRGLYMRTTK